MADTRTPSGYVAIFTDEHGSVIATACCFDRSPAAGFTDAQYQKMRVKERLTHEVARSYCGPDYVRALSERAMYLAVEELVSRFNCRVTLLRAPENMVEKQ